MLSASAPLPTVMLVLRRHVDYGRLHSMMCQR